ncbi:head maturation protease, ClpP-related [Melaminivora sp.]|uniref:head maturation protease, ClpP-related n=1 Tax=Melaminivora sp. TaxID=1933032 RepID=UPI0028A7879F|nr:head maturation protease, ClpP-related [Melaminivora sp.]
MTKRNLPAGPVPPAAGVRARVGYELAPRALELWRPVAAAEEKGEATISILDAVGFDPWSGDGVTAKRIAAVLRNIGERDVTVHINSPGGDVFEGFAIYNMLREHPGRVTVKVLGIAASIASVIAMAGDEIQVARAGFFMVHNAWGVTVGNRHDMRAAAEMLEPIDNTIADIYAARSGMAAAKASELMDAESWIPGADAIERGMADGLLSADAVRDAEPTASNAVRRLDMVLASSGMPRSERRKLIQEIKGTPSAALDGKPGAADPALAANLVDLMASLTRLEAAPSNLRF